MIKLERPLAFIDIEATGTDPAVDRIVTLGVLKVMDGMEPMRWLFRCNPGMEMEQEVIDVHGITNEMASGYQPFWKQAAEILTVIAGSDLAGFNLLNFDVPLLWEEFWRCQIDLNLDGVRIIDAGNIFKKKEERSLSAAVQFYCGRAIQGAHDAVQDASETFEVLKAQLDRYPDIGKMTIEQLHNFSRLDEDTFRVDLAGKIVRKVINGKLGDPEFTIRRVKGCRVVDELGFAEWMLGKEFPENTKLHIRRIIKEHYGKT